MKIENTKAYKDYIKKRNERMKSVKKGKNSFHLSYYNGLLTENEISEFKSDLEKIKLEFSSYDQSGDLRASFDDFSLTVFYIISQITIQEILSGTITNATWDTIKYVVLKTWKKVRNKSITKCTSSSSEEKEINFGIKISLDENTHFDFHLTGNLDEETILKSLDKTFEFISSQQKNKEYKFPNYVEYDKNKQQWKSIEFMELLKIVKAEQKKKNKISKLKK